MSHLLLKTFKVRTIFSWSETDLSHFNPKRSTKYSPIATFLTKTDDSCLLSRWYWILGLSLPLSPSILTRLNSRNPTKSRQPQLLYIMQQRQLHLFQKKRPFATTDERSTAAVYLKKDSASTNLLVWFKKKSVTAASLHQTQSVLTSKFTSDLLSFWRIQGKCGSIGPKKP